ncbi:hypothetical protein [Anaerovorax sp. IOR16]|uniref:hypothetical protein n=1 Tax=Anaerovorax sp. IOR16 TaxID=2773458 RepID=UPI0019D0783C|nr:hypothetical protein [Anaerovorax sp. IOR16]
MGNKISLLKCGKVPITPQLYVRIPTVGEVLDDEQTYFSILSSLIATPSSHMVQLDKVGIDFTEIKDYDLFLMLFDMLKSEDLSLFFGDMNTSNFEMGINNQNGETVFYNETNNIMIDMFVYSQIVEILRKITLSEKKVIKPANEEAKRYLLEKEKKKLKRSMREGYKPYLESLVIALVNTTEFKYNYEEVMNLSLYKFNQSFKQIQSKISFDNTMVGVYTGNIDTSKISDKSCLSWLSIQS